MKPFPAAGDRQRFRSAHPATPPLCGQFLLRPAQDRPPLGRIDNSPFPEGAAKLTRSVNGLGMGVRRPIPCSPHSAWSSQPYPSPRGGEKKGATRRCGLASWRLGANLAKARLTQQGAPALRLPCFSASLRETGSGAGKRQRLGSAAPAQKCGAPTPTPPRGEGRQKSTTLRPPPALPLGEGTSRARRPYGVQPPPTLSFETEGARGAPQSCSRSPAPT